MNKELEWTDWPPQQKPCSVRINIAKDHLVHAGFLVREVGGSLVATSNGEFASQLGVHRPCGTAHFLLVCKGRDVVHAACRVVAFIEAIAASPAPFRNPGVAFDLVREQYPVVTSDVLLVSKVFFDFLHAGRNQDRFRNERNLNRKFLNQATESYEKLVKVLASGPEKHKDDGDTATILEQAMFSSYPLLIAHQSKFIINCHQTASGVVVRCKEDIARTSAGVIPLDLRRGKWDGKCKARLTVVLPSLPYGMNCLWLSDSFVSVGVRGNPIKASICEQLRKEGFSETCWHCISCMRLRTAMEKVLALETVVDVAVVIYCLNDAVAHERVYELPVDFEAQVDAFLCSARDKCRRLVFVVPTSELFPRYHSVPTYRAAGDRLRKHLSHRGVSCPNASELIGLVLATTASTSVLTRSICCGGP